jgi:opacity protein-like surface antigen
VNTVGLNADYKRFVWPVISVSARYNFSYKKKISPYIGGGVGSVFVHTDAEFEDSMGSRHASSSDFLTAMHVFTGLELFSNKTTHVDIEIRYEITTDATKSDPVLHDGVDLGGYLFSIGVSW